MGFWDTVVNVFSPSKGSTSQPHTAVWAETQTSAPVRKMDPSQVRYAKVSPTSKADALKIISNPGRRSTASIVTPAEHQRSPFQTGVWRTVPLNHETISYPKAPALRGAQLPHPTKQPDNAKEKMHMDAVASIMSGTWLGEKSGFNYFGKGVQELGPIGKKNVKFLTTNYSNARR